MEKIGADSTDLVVADLGETELRLAARAYAVRERINEIKNDLTNKSLELGRLFREARDNEYNLPYGYPRFGDWVDAEMGDFGIKQREAYYLIAIVERADQLQLSDDKLRLVGTSKLKLILSLPPEQNDTVLALLEGADKTPLRTIKEAVEVAKGSEFTYLNLKLPRSVRDDVIIPAFEKIRRIFGNTISPEGELYDIPDWRCLEFACAEILAMPDEQEVEIADAEYADVVEIDNDGSQAYGMVDREI